MENRMIIKCLKNSVLISVIIFIVGLSFGIIMEKNIPSNYHFTILTGREILKNNIITLLNSLKYGFLSAGFYSAYFGLLYGKTVGQGVIILFDNYGMTGILYGFLPHAILETISCICAAILPIFCWNIILNIFLKKSNISKWKVLPKVGGIFVVIMLLVIMLCIIASYMEYNVSEMYLINK